MWKKLRDGYRSSVKRSKTPKSGTAAKNSPEWKFHQQMSFLQSYMKDKPCLTNACSSVAVTDEDLLNMSPENVGPISPNSEEGEQPPPSPPRKKQRTLPGKSNVNILTFLQEEAKKKEERCLERNEIRRQLLMKLGDGLKLFFDSMYASTKNLPEYLQKQVKRQLFQLVSAAEDEAETPRSYCNVPSVSPGSSAGYNSPGPSLCYNTQGVNFEVNSCASTFNNINL